MIHLRPIEPAPRKRCDTRALLEARANIKRQLQDEKAEREYDAKLPRHFKARELFRKQGEIA